MPYKFNFDLSKLSRGFFREVAKASAKGNIHGRIGTSARKLVEKFKVHKLVGLPVSDAITVVEDLMDVYIKNLTQKEGFSRTKKRALFLPHCSRKFMDSRCKASFDKEVSSYFCKQCSPDCLINKATRLGKKNGYDVYVLPGGSCVKKIFKRKHYDGIVGVSCCEELKLAGDFIKNFNIFGQAVPLANNGCSGTKFNLTSLNEIL